MAASHEQRKVVIVLFCDRAGSTALGETVDPELSRTLPAAQFSAERARQRLAELHSTAPR